MYYEGFELTKFYFESYSQNILFRPNEVHEKNFRS